jgi:aminopeptidase N
MSRRTRALALIAAASCCLAFAPAAQANGHGHGHGHGGQAGDPGLGDPYFPLEGNGGYDAQHYDLALAYDPASDRLDGVATITARALQDLASFDLDLQQLDVSWVAVNGRRAEFVRDGQELRITPRNRLHRHSKFRVSVGYGGVPETIVGSPIVFGSPYGFLHTDDGNFVGAEPNASSTWYPSNDHPADKATYVFRVTVPEGITAVANGRLAWSRTRHGKSTFVWYEDSPMATYLATVDTGHWIIRNGRTPGGVPETVAVDPVLPDVNGVPAVDFFFDTSAEAVDFETQYFGRYPFSSTGAIADNATYNGTPLGFSLETQTKPVYSAVRNTSTIAHELAHQWFGDSVSVQTWDNIWLNEGFATFAQYLWDDYKGVRTAHEAFVLDYARLPTDPFWQTIVANPQRDTMFARAVYRRGGMTLQALREKIGDEKFFTILKTWTREHFHGNATTKQFTDLAERISGQDLDAFFNTWLYTAGKPTTW